MDAGADGSDDWSREGQLSEQPRSNRDVHLISNQQGYTLVFTWQSRYPTIVEIAIRLCSSSAGRPSAPQIVVKVVVVIWRVRVTIFQSSRVACSACSQSLGPCE